MRSQKDESMVVTPKQLRFRNELHLQSRLDEVALAEGLSEKYSQKGRQKIQQQQQAASKEKPSFFDFFKVEMTRGYLLEHDEERYTARRKKIYSFMCIPRDLERFMIYGLMQCADSFLYIHTFLPIRFLMAVWGLLTRPIASCLGMRRRTQRLLTPAEICDLLKCTIWIAVTLLMLSIDTNRVYHIIKSQSIIKLYIFYNMLEVGDRLLSAFGQDTIDALFWTATESKQAKREHFGLTTHISFATIYVCLHSFLIMFQATTLNVAVNSNNKGLLTIMISNNFVELKGSVFKKFDKNNLFQLSCSDVRERFHLTVLLFIVMIQTMKEFDWSLAQFWVMLPDCFAVLITEVLIDWIKHAFITRFNELSECLYREYTTSLAYDMTQTRQKHAFSDHSDLLARRMGFIPFPLGVVLIKAVYSAVSFNNLAAWILCSLAFMFAMGLRICLTICALGKACKLMKDHQSEKSIVSTTTSSQTITTSSSGGDPMSAFNISGINAMTATPRANLSRLNAATSPINQLPLITNSSKKNKHCDPNTKESKSNTSITNNLDNCMPKQISKALSNITCKSAPVMMTKSTSKQTSNQSKQNTLDMNASLELGATALFSNSDVDLDDICLNEHVLEDKNSSTSNFMPDELARSQPDLQQSTTTIYSSNTNTSQMSAVLSPNSVRRTHRRSESEPSIQNIGNDESANSDMISSHDDGDGDNCKKNNLENTYSSTQSQAAKRIQTTKQT